MSLDAMTWARKQRGLKPAVKIVLWALADRHNPDLGYCFPDQDMLANECEISRASLNRHLLELEEAGLIKRVSLKDPVSRLQLNTRYFLALDTELATLDVVGRVSNCDTEIRVSNSAKSVSHSCETLITSKITSKNPLTPEPTGNTPPQDVGEKVHVRPDAEPALYQACCAVSGHHPGTLDRRFGWWFTSAVIAQAQAELASRGGA